MSAKWKILLLCAIVSFGALLAHDYMAHEVNHKMMAAGPGASPDLLTQVQLALSKLVALAGGVGAIIAWFHKFADALPASQTKDVVVAAADWATVKWYSNRWAKLPPGPEKESVKAAAQALFDQNFPETKAVA